MERSNSAGNQIGINLLLLLLVMACAIAGCTSNADETTTEAANVAVVRGYFAALDNGDTAAIPVLFAPDATQEFVGTAPYVGVDAIQTLFAQQGSQMQSMHTDILTTVAQGNTVAVQVQHNAVFKAGGMLRARSGITTSPLPPGAPAGLIVLPSGHTTPVTWRALAVFQLQNGMITSETIIRDEVTMMMQMGTLELTLNP